MMTNTRYEALVIGFVILLDVVVVVECVTYCTSFFCLFSTRIYL